MAKCKLCGMDNSKCYCGGQTQDRENMADEFKDICITHGLTREEIEKLVILSSHMLTGMRGEQQ